MQRSGACVRRVLQDAGRLDLVVTVVDASAFATQQASGTAQAQLAAADLVLLNKVGPHRVRGARSIRATARDQVDLVTPAELDEAEALLRALHPRVKIHRCTKCAVDLPLVLDVALHAAEADAHAR